MPRNERNNINSSASAFGAAEATISHSPLSKRAARRLIQRAFVLVGRDRHVRQHLREARMATLWVLEDWKFAWTVELDRGKLHLQRRPARRPDLTYTWQTTQGFFHQIVTGAPAGEDFQLTGNLELLKFSDPVYKAFLKVLPTVMQYPFDDEGNRLW